MRYDDSILKAGCDILLNPPTTWTPPAEVVVAHGLPDISKPLWLVDLYDHKIQAEPAAAFLWKDDEFLHMLCVMVDEFPHSTAAPRNDATWEKGDVVEIFLMPNAEKDLYYEFHITPNQAIIEYAIPNAEKLRNGEYDWSMLDVNAGTKSEAAMFSGSNHSGWFGHIRVPLKLFAHQLGERSKVAVARYNFPADPSAAPLLSASCNFPIPRYHLPECWHFTKI